MIRPENKDIANEHPRGKKVIPERIRVADISDKMTIKEINEYIRRYQSGEATFEVLPPGLTEKELIQLRKLAEKRT